MPWYVRIDDARLTRVGTAALLLAIAASASLTPAVAQPSSSDVPASEPPTPSPDQLSAEEYRLRQREMVLEVRAIRENLLTPEVLDAYRRIERDFTGIMARGTREQSAEFRVVQDGLRYLVYSATDPAKQSAVGLEIVLKDLDRKVRSAGQQINDSRERKQFRSLVCRETLRYLRDLLSNDFDARSFAIGILPELEVSTSRDRVLEIYEGVDEVLVEVLQDPAQPDAVKVRAAQSIALFLEKENPGTQVEMDFARAIQSELRNTKTEAAYQYFLVSALSGIRAGRAAVGNPRRAVPIETLVSVMEDPRRDLLVRCRAAAALGEVGYDSQIRFEPLAWKVLQLAVETALEYNGRPNDPNWAECGQRLFLAFHHSDKDRSEGPNAQGFLNRGPESQLIRDAYARILPIAAKITFGQDVPEKALVDADRWLNQNRPDNLAYDPYADPVKP